jgi:protease-4
MHKSFLRETATAVMKAVVVVTTIIVVVATLTALYQVETGVSDGQCNIAVLPIEGVILPYHGLGDFEFIITPETVESFMKTVEGESQIEAVLIEINSPGGTPVASERIAERFRSSSLPVVGVIGDVGASGGYMIAAATDYLIASPMSDVGSIGVNMSYVEESAKNEEEGLTYVQLTTGKFKDIGNPNRPITDEERELLQADLDIIHNEFINIVSKYRGLDRDKIVALADGASMPGVRALEAELIDELGGRKEATSVLSKILEIDEEDIKYCEYDRGFILF